MSSPGLPGFDYLRPTSAQQVVKLLLQSDGQARLLMGGTDVLVRLRDGVIAPARLIDVKHLPGMREIRYHGRRGLAVGAAANMNALAHHPAVGAHYPVLAQALASVASYPLRTRATLGGNLCNASPAADTAPAALVYDAQLVVFGRRGERCIPAAEFFLGPGRTALKRGEFLLRIELPLAPAGAAGRYLKLGRNAQGDLAIVGAAALGWPSKKTRSGLRFRLALASVAPTPSRVPEAEALLESQPLNEQTIEQAAEAAARAARPIDDVRASAAYRRAMVGALMRQALHAILNELEAAHEPA